MSIWREPTAGVCALGERRPDLTLSAEGAIVAGRVNGASARKSGNSIHAMPAQSRTSRDSYW